MNRERAREIAKEIRRKSFGSAECPMLVTNIADAIISACELEAAAVREECASIADQIAEGHHMPFCHEVALAIRSRIPADALDEFERKVRLDEAEWWARHVNGVLYHNENCKCVYCCRFASLKPPAPVEKV